MKSRWIGAAALAIVIGFLVSQAFAGPLVKVQVELAPGQSGQIGPGDANVLLNVWAYLAGKNNSTTDDGVGMVSGSLRSGNGGLLGDLSFTLNASGTDSVGWWHGGFTMAPANAGTRQDLDGDGDLDIGGRDGNLPNSTYGYWVFPNSLFYIPTSDGNRELLGTAVFTLTDPDPSYGSSTSINWSYQVKKTGPVGAQHLDAFTVDGTNYDLKGDSNQIGTGPDALVTWGEELTITYALPEPATLSMLALGGVAILRRGRKR